MEFNYILSSGTHFYINFHFDLKLLYIIKFFLIN